MKQASQVLKNNRGFLAADFLFSMILACVLCMLLFAMSVTYVSVEVAQYIAFSAARAGAAADVDIDAQKARALFKLTGSGRSNSALTPLLPTSRPSPLKVFFNNEWFSLSLKDQKMGGNSSTGGSPSDSYEDEYPKDTYGDGSFIPQVGLRLSYSAKILNLRVAYLGSSHNNGGTGFNATVTGFVTREPSQKECMDLMSYDKRFRKILDLDIRYQSQINLYSISTANYLAMEDNGC